MKSRFQRVVWHCTNPRRGELSYAAASSALKTTPRVLSISGTCRSPSLRGKSLLAQAPSTYAAERLRRPNAIAAARAGTIMIARIQDSACHGNKKSRSFQNKK
jgi:hypothetical protein